jgi:hypothetical protein
VNGDVVDLDQVPLEAFAVSAVGVFEDRHLALTVAAHQGESVFEWQIFKCDGCEFGQSLFGEINPFSGVDQIALDQVVALSIRVHDLAVVEAQLVDAWYGCFADSFDFRKVGITFRKVFTDGSLCEGSHACRDQSQCDGESA